MYMVDAVNTGNSSQELHEIFVQMMYTVYTCIWLADNAISPLSTIYASTIETVQREYISTLLSLRDRINTSAVSPPHRHADSPECSDSSDCTLERNSNIDLSKNNAHSIDHKRLNSYVSQTQSQLK
jgi:hypothetical protein